MIRSSLIILVQTYSFVKAHGVDTGRWVDTKREDSLCHSSEDVEDEQHFIFDCPAYDHVRKKYDSIFSKPDLFQTFCKLCAKCMWWISQRVFCM